MANFIGVLLVLGGVLLAWSIGGIFWAIWCGVTALGLVFIGMVTLLIAFSERRAHRQYRQATQDISKIDNEK